MVYSQHAPFEILSNRSIDFGTMHRLRRFARYWDLIANSGNFLESLPLIWCESSPFRSFMRLSDWLFAQENRTHAIPLKRLTSRMFEFVVSQCGLPEAEVGPRLLRDYQRGGRRDIPEFLRSFDTGPPPSRRESKLPSRQARHSSG